VVVEDTVCTAFRCLPPVKFRKMPQPGSWNSIPFDCLTGESRFAMVLANGMSKPEEDELRGGQSVERQLKMPRRFLLRKFQGETSCRIFRLPRLMSIGKHSHFGDLLVCSDTSAKFYSLTLVLNALT
jgi:hypothetical protein